MSGPKFLYGDVRDRQKHTDKGYFKLLHKQLNHRQDLIFHRTVKIVFSHDSMSATSKALFFILIQGLKLSATAVECRSFIRSLNKTARFSLNSFSGAKVEF